MKLIKKYSLLLMFALFVTGAAAANLATPDREKSDMENRYLAQFPTPTLRSLLETQDKQKYTYKFEQWVNDQFIGRDFWIGVKSVSESAIGKIENNGIIYGDDGFMFEEYITCDMQQLEKNTDFVAGFYEKYHDKTNIQLAIIPSSYAVLPEKLPAGLKNVDQAAMTAQMYARLPQGVETLDLFSMFAAMPEQQREASFYRTDHHWTTYGAFETYKALAASRGLEFLQDIDAPKHEAGGFYGTFFSKCKKVTATPDTITYYDIPFTSIEIDGGQKPGLYDEAQWTQRDKYSAFIWSNNGLTVIKSDNNLNKQPGKTTRLLLVKDSFSNCLAPFLTYSYDEVYVVDLRFLKESMSALMESVEFDDTLVLYNFMSFASDKELMFLNR